MSARYIAFISYSHRDRKWAEWLHRAIETYRIPRDVRAEGTRTALSPIFLDRAELPSSSDLAASVREAITASDYLIVICSPSAAGSHWVNEEIRTFKALGRAERILCLIVAGRPSALPGRGTEESFPPAIRFTVESGLITAQPAAEPLAADVRPGKDSRRDASLKIIAGLLGLPLDRLRQREQMRRNQRLAIIASVSGVGCIAFGTLAVLALHARNEAERQRIHAEQQTLTARRTADFLKSLFSVSDPSEARGNSITAREVLDRGVRQIDTQLAREPQVRADLTTTIGEVYSGLGLLTEAERLLEQARVVPGQSVALSARQAMALGEVRQLRGEYATALPLLGQAAELLAREPLHDSALEARLLAAFGDVYQGLDDYTHSAARYGALVSLARTHAEVGKEMLARGLLGVAQSQLEAGNADVAERTLREALAAQGAATGEQHPRASEILNELGNLEYSRQNLDAAIGYYERSVAIERRVLGEHHPQLAIGLNNLARVLLERRRFGEARELLTEALTMRAPQVVDTNDLSAFILNNLAIAHLELGEPAAAEPLFVQALRAARANRQRLEAPILASLADLKCQTGRFAQGMTHLDAAAPLMASRYPEEPWRIAYVDNMRGGCLTAAHRYAEAEPLLERSTPAVLQRWPKDSLYGHDALARSIRLKALMRGTESAVANAHLHR